MTNPSVSNSVVRARALATLRTAAREQPRVAVVLGSGLGGFADTLAGRVVVDYARVEGMAASAVAGHAGCFVLGRHGALPVVTMQGRLHLYEGHSPERVVLGVRTMIALGARTVILTNAAGGIREDLGTGSLMLIADHLNLTGRSCLVGPNDDTLGPRFPALNDAYDPDLRALAERCAAELGIELSSGVYAGMLGPSYETPAEIRMLAMLGADAVGMSTVLETIAARHMGARCLGLSCITNRAAGLGDAAPSHAEVEAEAANSRARFEALLGRVLEALARAGGQA